MLLFTSTNKARFVFKFDYFIYIEPFLIFHYLFKHSCKTHHTEKQIVGQK
jgi:hypothetical protein